jgi:hypothetical protein
MRFHDPAMAARPAPALERAPAPPALFFPFVFSFFGFSTGCYTSY